MAGGDQGLLNVAAEDVGAQTMAGDRAAIRRDLQFERASGLEQPKLVGVDAVPVGALHRGQQEQNGASGAAPFAPAPGLAVPAALRMGGQAESGDDAALFARHA